MSRSIHVMQLACWIGGLVLAALLAALASVHAHSEGDCANNGISSCNKSYPNNYDARLACANSVLTACAGHKHGGTSASLTSAAKPRQPPLSPLLRRRQ